jgi:hypothetical protein
MKTKLIAISAILYLATAAFAQGGEDSQSLIDPGKPDLIVLDSVQTKAGQSVEMALRALVDDTTWFSERSYVGVGSFCIPFKYDVNVMKVDSVKFKNAVLSWDEKFTNPKFDTGFVSLGGIYTLTGKEKPALLSPKEPTEIARIYMSVLPDAKPGNYVFEITKDPRQGNMFFGSIDGYHSWRPVYVGGKVVVE